MEVAGLALGIAGLAGIISTCFDVLDRVDCYKTYRLSSRQLAARFEAAKLKLREWAQSVGYTDGKLKDDHHSRLDQPEVALIVRKFLALLCETFDKANEVGLISRNRKEAHDPAISTWQTLQRRSTGDSLIEAKPNSKKAAIGWALNRKGQLKEQIEMFELLVDKLNELVPPNKAQDYMHTALNNGLRVSNSQAVKDSDTFDRFQADFKRLVEDFRRREAIEFYKAVDHYLDVPKFDQQILDKNISARLDGTCEWIFKHDAYISWASTDFPDKTAKLLWICAPAGHGKTVLSARVFQYFKEHGIPPPAVFFSSNYVQAGGSLDGVLRSWISQMTKDNHDVLDIVRDNLRWDSTDRQVALEEVWKLFAEIISQIPSCTLILDGLDEYSNVDESRRKFLRRLLDTVEGTETRIWIASRVESDVESEIKAGSTAGPNKLTILECKMTEKVLGEDITLFSRRIVAEQLPKLDSDLQEELAKIMATKCEGMFLWINLQKTQLRGQAWKGITKLRKIVESMPSNLNQIFERKWQEIQSNTEDRERAINILRWVALAERPLTVAELTEALVIKLEDDEEPLCLEDLPEEIDDDYVDAGLKSLCASLIEVRSQVSADGKPTDDPATVHLIHVSVKEYLLTILPIPILRNPISNTIQPLVMQHIFLLENCLHYLNFGGTWERAKTFEPGKLEGAFLKYATASWFKHVDVARPDIEHLVYPFTSFFCPGNKNFGKWAAYVENGTTSEQPQDTQSNERSESNANRGYDNASAVLYFAAFYELSHVMEYIHNLGSKDTEITPFKHGTALQATCWQGNHKEFDRLISWRVDVNQVAGDQGTALNAACSHNRRDMVEVLLKNGANPNQATGSWKSTPLYIACRGGYLEIVRMLLNYNADVSLPSNFNWTPLTIAANGGHLEVMKLLLEKGADMSETVDGGWTALSLACDNGLTDVVRFAIDNKAEVTVMLDEGWIPIGLAARKGHTEIVKLLLENGAGLTDKSKEWAPIHTAALGGHVEVTRLLLDRGADVNSSDEKEQTPLHYACDHGHLALVQLLLDRGANVRVPNPSGWTSLCLASSAGQLEICRLLLQHGAVDVLHRDKFGSTAIAHAAQSGHVEIVEMLLDHQANTTAIEQEKSTSLRLACETGQLEIVKVLLDRGVDLTSANDDHHTALSIAIWNNRYQVVELLLKNGANPSRFNTGSWNSYPMTAAIWARLPEMIRLMLSYGADPNSRPMPQDDWTNCTMTTLLFAALTGSSEIVTLLLDHGADVNGVDVLGLTSAMHTAKRGQSELARRFINAGVDVNETATTGIDMLRFAIINGDRDFFNFLVDKGAAPERRDCLGQNCTTWLELYGYSQEDIRLWKAGDPAGLDERQRIVQMSEVICDAANKILDTQNRDDPLWDLLQKCFIYMNMLDEAIFVGTLCIEEVDDNGMAAWLISCEACGSPSIKGDCWVCQMCPYIEMCGDCKDKISTTDKSNRCHKHKFLRIPGVGLKPFKAAPRLRNDPIPMNKDENKFLKTCLERFGPGKSDKSASPLVDVIAQGIVKEKVVDARKEV